MDPEINISSNPKEWPLITIGVPTHNGAHRLKKALASVMSQCYPNLEVLISDNDSSDNTAGLCAELMKKWPGIKVFRQDRNIGIIRNFEFLLKQARGKYFMWLSDDDTLAADALKKCVEFLEDNPQYSLVSGNIEYWLNGRVSMIEHGFNFQQRSPSLRVISYYSKVINGGIFHGLMRTGLAQQLEIRNVLGSDWHFVASLAFLGKIKNLDFIGYRKKFGGSSRNFVHYAKLLGESTFAGRHPHMKIPFDAFKEIWSQRSVYSSLPHDHRLSLALSAFLATWLHYYAFIYPFVIGGKIKRWLKSTLTIKKYTLLAKSKTLARRYDQ